MHGAILILVGVFLIIGLIGTLVPVLPGVGLIFGGILLYALYFGIETIGISTLLLLGGVTLFSIVLDYLAASYGAKTFGASSAGSLGAVIGGLIGLFVLNLPGLLLGVFLGAALTEWWIARQTAHGSLKAGFGAVIGFLGGTVLKLILGILLVVVFLMKIW